MNLSTTHRFLLAASALALALFSYFVLVVHEAAQRGQMARLEGRQAGPAAASRFAVRDASARPPQRDMVNRR